MNPADSTRPRARRPALPAASLWVLTALFSAGPGWLLLTNAETGMVKVAALALLVAAVIAAGTGAACVRGASTLLSGAGSLVVLLCLAAMIALVVDGWLSPGGAVLFGGAAVGLALLARALTLQAAMRTE